MSVSVYSQSPSPLGKSVYHFAGVSVPKQFVPTLVYEAKLNGTQTNTWVRVDTRYPILSTVDGVTTRQNEFKMYTEYSSLNSVLSTAERERVFDEHVRFLLANRPGIINGNLTTAAVTPVVPNPTP